MVHHSPPLALAAEKDAVHYYPRSLPGYRLIALSMVAAPLLHWETMISRSSKWQRQQRALGNDQQQNTLPKPS